MFINTSATMNFTELNTDCANLQMKKMNKTTAALHLLWLLCTEGYFKKEKALAFYEISQRTFSRAVSEIRSYLIEYNISKELIYDKKTANMS